MKIETRDGASREYDSEGKLVRVDGQEVSPEASEETPESEPAVDAGIEGGEAASASPRGRGGKRYGHA